MCGGVGFHTDICGAGGNANQVCRVLAVAAHFPFPHWAAEGPVVGNEKYAVFMERVMASEGGRCCLTYKI